MMMPEFERRRRSRSLAIFLALLTLVLLFFGITIARQAYLRSIHSVGLPRVQAIAAAPFNSDDNSALRASRIA